MSGSWSVHRELFNNSNVYHSPGKFSNDYICSYFFQKIGFWHSMQFARNVKAYLLRKIRKHFKMSSADPITQYAKH